MIKVIGFQKVLLLMILAFLLSVFILYSNYIAAPQVTDTKKQLRTNRKEVGELTTDINKLVEGLKTFEEQKGTFEKLENTGFFDAQNRLKTSQRLKEMQKESKLLSARFSIGSVVKEENKLATEAGLKVLNTEITLTLNALEDIDIYNFIYLLNYGLPGQVLINSLAIKKEQDITQPLLRKLGSGNYETLVRAELQASWRTLIPDSTLEVEYDGNEEGN